MCIRYGLKGRQIIAQGNALGPDGTKKSPLLASLLPPCGAWREEACVERGELGGHHIPRVPLRLDGVALPWAIVRQPFRLL